MTARVHNTWSPNWYPFKSLFRYIFSISNALSKIPLSCWPYLCWNKFPGIPVALLPTSVLRGSQLFVPVPGFCVPLQLLLSAVFECTMWFLVYLNYYKSNQWYSLQLFHYVIWKWQCFCWRNLTGDKTMTVRHLESSTELKIVSSNGRNV